MSAGDIYFVAVADRGKMGLKLYVKGLAPGNRKWIKQACFLLLDHALGEYDAETKVGFVEFKSLPAGKVPAGAKSLSGVASAVDRMSRKLRD